MIGILAKGCEVRAVQEFFQLFKTPWEFYIPGRSYEVVILTLNAIPDRIDTRVVIVYNSCAVATDDQFGIAMESAQTDKWEEWQGVEWPVYGNLTTFRGGGSAFLRQRESGETVGIKVLPAGSQLIRIGLDLFSEVAFLLSQGQP